MITPDRRSDKVLDSLRGYTRRQPWVKDDLPVIQLLFDSLDEARGRISYLERQQADFLAQHKSICDAYEHRIDYLEYRVKEEQNKGVMSYLKFLVAPCR